MSSRALVSLQSILFAVILSPCLAHAQAWVPFAHNVRAYMSYGYQDVGDHLFSVPDAGDGDNGLDLGDIDSQTITFGLDYGVTQRLAAYGSINYVSSRYQGEMPESHLDNGNWNSGFADFDLGLRYQALTYPIMITPSLAVTVPTHDYETLGHSALGSGLTVLHAGLDVGWLPVFVPRTYVQLSYAHSFYEQFHDMKMNRGQGALLLGYFLSPSLSLNAFTNYLFTNGGVDWWTDLESDEEVEMHWGGHDRYADASAWKVGGGVAYEFAPAFGVGLGVETVLWGENTNDATQISLSTSWNGFLFR
jgi:hypothetical protein